MDSDISYHTTSPGLYESLDMNDSSFPFTKSSSADNKDIDMLGSLSLVDWINKDVFLPSTPFSELDGLDLGVVGLESESSHDLTTTGVIEASNDSFDSYDTTSLGPNSQGSLIPQESNGVLVAPVTPELLVAEQQKSNHGRRKAVLQKRIVEEITPAVGTATPSRKRKESGVDENIPAAKRRMHELDPDEHPEAKGAVQSRVNREKRKQELMRLRLVERKYNKLQAILGKILKSQGTGGAGWSQSQLTPLFFRTKLWSAMLEDGDGQN